MALFGKKKKEEKNVAVAMGDAFNVLKAPCITEKAAIVTEKGAYVFTVYRSATKGAIKKAIQAVYKVNPVRVNVVNTPKKKVTARLRTIRGSLSGRRKAYVYLKKGDTIEIL